MKKYAGLRYHCKTLCLEVFPAGKHGDIDWDNIVFSDCGFDFYMLKSGSEKSESAKKSYIEYSDNSAYNINSLRLKEIIRYKCRICRFENDAETGNYRLHFRNEYNKNLKIERDDEKSLVFQFVNYLGKSALFFDDGVGGEEEKLAFEVVPDKIDYETDYINLTQAIADECSALLLEYSSPTSLNFSQDSKGVQKTALEQFIFLRQFCYSDNMDSLFASVKRNPDSVLIEEKEFMPFGQGSPSKNFFVNPFSYSRNWYDSGKGYFLPSEVVVARKCESLDTPANRFLKYALNVFLEICEKVIVYVEESSVYYSEASEIKESIENILQDAFFDDVSDLTIMPVNNQVLEKREGYFQVFKAFSMADLALQLDWKGKDDVYAGESKNTALLYEYWLFFELRRIISEIHGCSPICKNDEDSFIKENDGLQISLKQEKLSVQRFETAKHWINLYYNRTFYRSDFVKTKYYGSYSRPFRPDYTIAIFPKIYSKEELALNAGAVSYIHFDAKYRLDDLKLFINNESKDEIEKEISEEKEESVLNTYKRGDLLKMHTYNDAIRRTVGSYVLYPGTDYSKCFSVYEEVLPGVGAFAIRPSDNGKFNSGEKAVKEFIEKIIEYNANPAGRLLRTDFFERMVAETPGVSDTPDFKPVVKPEEPGLTMIGFMRETYYDYLKSKGVFPCSYDDINCIGKKFYFYFHAIKNGRVYTIHSETSKAKYLRITLDDYYEIIKTAENRKIKKLEPWRAEIISMELVSKSKLTELLDDFPHKDSLLADFYYVVKAEISDLFNGGIAGVSMDENDMISPYSPKILQLFDGDKR